MQTGQTPYLPQMGGDPPRTKNIFVRDPSPKICKGRVGEGSPQGGEIEKVPHPQNFRTPFSQKFDQGPMSKNSGMKGDASICQ